MSVITEIEAEKQGMSEIEIAYGFLTGDIIPDPNRDHRTPNEKEHCPVVGSRMEPYHDVTIYADGFEDWYYIGD